MGFSTSHKILQLPGNKSASRFMLPSLQWQGVILLFAFSKKKAVLEYNISAVFLLTSIHGFVKWVGDTSSSAVQMASFLIKSWTINHKQLSIWFKRRKTWKLFWFNKVSYQTAAGGSHCNSMWRWDFTRKRYSLVSCNYMIGACIFTLAPLPLETQVSLALIAVCTISPWIFLQFMVLQLMAESAHIHVPPVFFPFSSPDLPCHGCAGCW